MRNFPRTARRRKVTVSLTVALALGAMSLPSSTALADDLKDKQKKVEKQIDHAEDDVHASSARLRRAQARLDAAEAQLTSAKAALASARSKVQVAKEKDAEMEAALDQAESDLEQAEDDLAAGQEQRDEQRQVVANTVVDVYEEGDPDLLAFASILGAETTSDLTRRAEVRDVVVSRQENVYSEYKAAEVLLGVREQQVAEARDEVADQRAAAAEHLEYTQQIQAERQSAADAVRRLVQERSGAQAQAQRAKASDIAQLRKLEQEQNRIEEMLRERARKRLGKGGGSSSTAGGTLAMPVQGGYVTSPYGYRTHPIYGYYSLHDGTDFGGGCGVPLVAAEDGKVISSYWSDVYGHRLVLDHGVLAGSSLASIYNHASSYTVGVGSRVKRGQVIGYMGNTGWSTGCHLHYTVMQNGRTVDPMKWL
ncbi:MAG: peptidoglycan DD-metalloendopeptidase family protein [Nocardioides sp.]|uniref:peptidoglycan DD-metalloendopeptidase family protein n=1 Tax=Nocardioides sp. TaxID=35761 RepID=UPI003F00ACFA